MTMLDQFAAEPALSPIEMIEALADASDLQSHRIDDTEVHVCLTGSWRDVALWFAWRAEAQVLQIGAPLEMKVPARRKAEVTKLLALVNERLWIGHFDYQSEEDEIVYRNGVVLSDGQELSENQAEVLLRAATDAFEQYYPAFNYVIWAGKTAEEAVTSVILEPVGTA